MIFRPGLTGRHGARGYLLVDTLRVRGDAHPGGIIQMNTCPIHTGNVFIAEKRADIGGKTQSHLASSKYSTAGVYTWAVSIFYRPASFYFLFCGGGRNIPATPNAVFLIAPGVFMFVTVV